MKRRDSVVFLSTVLSMLITGSVQAENGNDPTAPRGSLGNPSAAAPDRVEPAEVIADPKAAVPANQNVPLEGRPERDVGAGALDNGTTEADRLLATRLRKAIVSDQSLSASAQNVKIAVNNGEVTLKGTVLNEREHQRIAAAALGEAGSGHIVDQLEVQSAEVPEK